MKKWKVLSVLLVVLIAAVYYYIELPAINNHSTGFWFFIIAFVLLLVAAFVIRRKIRSRYDMTDGERRVVTIGLGAAGLLVVIFVVGSVLSSPIVNAKKYHELIQPEERDFAEDIKQISFDQIPLLDKDSAELLGNRKMGSMVDMVSQFEVSDLYSQINYQNKPMRVTPLVYASPIKWLTNQANGIPAYIRIDMTNQETELVKLDEPIRYSEAEYFNRNIYRHLRFNYPTYIFDQLSFEIDDDGVPYWVCPVKKFNIGLFGGQTIGRVVLCNAQTGECTDYAIEDCPQWVDRAYPADLLIELYDYHGKMVNGFINSIFGQKGCLMTTTDYNYLAIDDDVWVYTGVTSVSGDQSIVGFVLMNQRTMETRYYSVSGAEESSAMSSAEGQVQNLGYQAAFPLLLNISNQPTYFMALKDDAGLVKKYAMVNVQKYQSVAIGDTAAECEQNYVKLLSEDGIVEEGSTESAEEITGTIARIAQSVIDGNSHFYLVLEGDEKIFDVPVKEFLSVVALKEGDTVKIQYMEGETVCTVLQLEKK